MSAREDQPSASELRALLDIGPELLALLAPDLRLRFVSRSLAALLGRPAAELEGCPAQAWLAPASLGAFGPDLRRALEGGPVVHSRLQLRHASGAELGLRVVVARLPDSEALAVRAGPVAPEASPPPTPGAFDPLTMLPNRSAFIERLQRWTDRARRSSGHDFGLLLLDLDRFRNVNDSLGHHVGDRLVALFARRLAASVRPGDLVARVGGDSFAVLVECLHGPDEARLVSERLQRILAEPLLVDNHEIYVSVSVGVSFSAAEKDLPLQVLREAEAAMHSVKEGGGGRFELFGGRLADAGLHLRLETGLRRALERGEFRAHYQPIVSLADGTITSFEVLARWQDRERGLLPPSEFIAAAEETGLIVPIANQLLREACAQARRWQLLHPERPPIGISMNFTGSHFERAEVTDTVLAALAASGLDPCLLTVEVTESVMMRNVEAVVAVLRDLRARGVHVHLDDFGTGYSSLSYLQRLPCDALKVDRSFVSGMESERDKALLVRTIVDLAHGLGRAVVAEGVEDRAQLAALQALGCEYVQGYLFSRPLDAESVIGLLADPPAWLTS